MALTATELLAGINAAFTDAASWNRAMLRLALEGRITEQEGVIAQGRATIGKRDVAEQAWIEGEMAKLAALQAQLQALAARPTVPIEPAG